MAAAADSPRERLPESPSPERDVSAFQDPAANAIADELRDALEPGIQVLRPLGAGAMGLVFLGRDPLLKRLVAIKVLAPQAADTEAARARFVREAESSAAVAHPSVVSVYLVGELPRSRTPYFVMQFIEGRTLADEIVAGVLSEPRAKRLIGEIASALAAAHARGLVHRDVKPANVILETESDRPVVLDFGISALLQPEKSTDAKLTRAGTYLGTPTYMSPEQASGEPVTGKSDVYALGALAFEMLAGQPPFQGPAFVVMAAHVEKPAPSLQAVRSGIDAHLATIVERCLRKNPDERPSAADIAQSLLPDRRALIEWPPPGLESLRGRGAKVLTYAFAACIAVVLSFLLLHARPTIVSPEWQAGETSGVWNGVKLLTAGGDATPIWTFLVGLCAAVLVALIVVTGVLIARLAREMFGGARAGYPARVLFDVAWDRHDDTSAVLNGTGGYALLDADQRQRVTNARRVSAVVGIASVLATALFPLAWLAGLLGSGSAPDVITNGELIGFIVPGLLGLAALALVDRRLRTTVALPHGDARRRRKYRPELVDSWIRASGAGERAARRDRFVPLVGSAVAGAVLLVMGYLAVVVFYVAFVGALKVSEGRRHMDAWLAGYGADSTRPLSFAEFDSIQRRSSVPVTKGPPDLEAGRLVIARGFLGQTLPPEMQVLAVDLEGARALQRSGAEPVSGVPALVFEVLGSRKPVVRAKVEAIAAYAQSPWLDAWRRMARSSDYPELWVYRPEFAEARSPWTLPVARFVGTKDLAYRNTVAGYVALVHGDVPSAIARGRETIAVGLQFMRGGSFLEHLIGIVITGIGGEELMAVGQATNNRALIEEALQLRATRIRLRREELRSKYSWLAMAADPTDRAMIRHVQRVSVPAYFGLLLASSTAGYCLNSREVLFGINPARAELIDDVGRAWGAPRAPEMQRVFKNWLDDVNAGRGTLPADIRSSIRLLAPLDWIGLGKLRNRIEMCAVEQMFF